MTFSGFFGYGLLNAVLGAGLTIILAKYVNLVEPWNHYVLWFLTLLVAIGTVRRLGHITYLESTLTAGVWLFLRMLLDALVTAPLLGVGIYGGLVLWLSYVLIAIAVMLIHKKRHVRIRKELHAQHHGHH